MKGLETLVSAIRTDQRADPADSRSVQTVLRLDPEHPRLAEAVRELRSAGLKGSEAVAWLIENLLFWRSPLIVYPLAVAGEMELSTRLYVALKHVSRAIEVGVGSASRWSENTRVVRHGGADVEVAFWSDETNKHVKELAGRALAAMCAGAGAPTESGCAACGRSSPLVKDYPVLTWLQRPGPSVQVERPGDVETRDYRWHPFRLCASCARRTALLATLEFGGMAVLMGGGVLAGAPGIGLLAMIAWVALCLPIVLRSLPRRKLFKKAIAVRRADAPERFGFVLVASLPPGPGPGFVATWDPAEPHLDIVDLLSGVPSLARKQGRVEL